MAEWCEGSLGIRGKTDDVIRFFKEGFERYRYDKEAKMMMYVPYEPNIDKIGSNSMTVYFENIIRTQIHIKDTTRAYIDFNYNYYHTEVVYFDIVKNEELASSRIAIKQAYDYYADEWFKIADKYHLDVSLYGIESSVSKTIREISIINGEVKIDSYINPKDWLFECPFPWMGG